MLFAFGSFRSSQVGDLGRSESKVRWQTGRLLSSLDLGRHHMVTATFQGQHFD